MSATGRGSERNEDDFYATPAWCVHRLLEKWDAPAGRWLEPGAGSGSIIKALGAHWNGRVSWTGVDIRKAPDDLWVDWFVGDLLSPEMLEGLAGATEGGGFGVALGNPPYKLAQAFADRCFMLAEHTALLLRLNFLGSEERAEWWDRHPADIYVLPNRPSFCVKVKCKNLGCGWKATFGTHETLPQVCPRAHALGLQVTRTDATEYAWFVWGEGGTVGKRAPRHYHLALTPEAERYNRAA